MLASTVLALSGIAAGQSVTLEFIGLGNGDAAINDRGQVVGVTGPTGEQRLWRYTDGAGIQPLGTDPYYSAFGLRINASGQVAFSGATPSDTRAYRYTDGIGLVDLGSLGDPVAFATGINDQGQVSGASFYANSGLARAVRYTDGSGWQDLGDFGEPNSHVTTAAINNAGQVVGTAEGLRMRAFRYTDGVGMLDLGTLGGSVASARGINGRGDVFGWSATASGMYEGFLYTDADGMRSLGLPGLAELAAMNDGRWIVGTTNSHAILWTEETGTIDLNALLPPGADAILYDATGINNSSQIVGHGVVDGQGGIYRLTIHAIPTPSGTAAGFCGVLLAGGRRRRRA